MLIIAWIGSVNPFTQANQRTRTSRWRSAARRLKASPILSTANRIGRSEGAPRVTIGNPLRRTPGISIASRCPVRGGIAALPQSSSDVPNFQLGGNYHVQP